MIDFSRLRTESCAKAGLDFSLTRASTPHRRQRRCWRPFDPTVCAPKLPRLGFPEGDARTAGSSRQALQRLCIPTTHCFCIDNSLFITSCKIRHLLTTGCSQVQGCRFAAQRAANDDEAAVLQKTQAVADIPFGTGQSADELLVRTRYHTSGPLLIARSPEQNTLLEPREAYGCHDSPPYACSGQEGSIWGDGAPRSPTESAPVSGPVVCPDSRCRRERPVCTACPATWTVARSRAVRWIIHGADGTTWLAGSVPCPMSRLITVALTSHGRAACESVSQSLPFGKFGRRY